MHSVDLPFRHDVDLIAIILDNQKRHTCLFYKLSLILMS